MDWLYWSYIVKYWNYIVNCWNYIKNNWNYIKNNWNELDYRSKRCIYFILIVYIGVFMSPIVPKLYNISKKRIVNIISFMQPFFIDHYSVVNDPRISNNIRH